MMPDLPRAITRFNAAAACVEAICRPLDAQDATFRPADGAWSIVEIINHLADEEQEDFRMRLRLTLTDPTAEWPPIDPERAARERGYQRRDLGESLDRFAAERGRSIRWLRSLRGDDPAWRHFKEHPVAGRLTAVDLLASWLAHDALHLRQLSRRLYQLVERDHPGADIGYAGRW